MRRPKSRTLRRRQQRQLERLESRLCLAGDLIAHWTAESLTSTLEDGSTVTEWNDSVVGRSARGSGEPTLVNDVLGGRSVVRFDASDGADEFQIVQTDNPLINAGDFSIAVVFVTSSDDLQGGNEDWYLNTGIVDANSQGFTEDWGITINTAGQISAGMGDGFLQPASTVYSSAAGLNDGQLHIVILTRSGGTLSLYVDDGAPDSRDDASVKPRSNNIQVAFGRNRSIDAPFNGDIAEVRFYDGASRCG